MSSVGLLPHSVSLDYPRGLACRDPFSGVPAFPPPPPPPHLAGEWGNQLEAGGCVHGTDLERRLPCGGPEHAWCLSCLCDCVFVSVWLCLCGWVSGRFLDYWLAWSLVGLCVFLACLPDLYQCVWSGRAMNKTCARTVVGTFSVAGFLDVFVRKVWRRIPTTRIL